MMPSGGVSPNFTRKKPPIATLVHNTASIINTKRTIADMTIVCLKWGF